MKKKENNRSMDQSRASCYIGIDNLLPTEITIDILSRLPFESILQCRLVCKTWLSLIHHPLFTRSQLLHPSGKVGFIFLTCLANNSSKELHYVEYDENDVKSCKTLARIKLHLPNDALFIVGSCNGLVCISLIHRHFFNDSVYICNPITRECVNLPSYINFADATVGGFGYHSFTNEYKVVRIYYPDKLPIGLVKVYTLGGAKGWRKKGEIPYSLLRYHYFSPGIFANGALHWMENQGKIVAFDLADEKFQLLPSPPCFYPGAYDFKLTLFRGSLCVVHYNKGKSIDIWSLEKKSHEWECLLNMDARFLLKKSRTWERMFKTRKRRRIEDYVPFAFTEKGEVLLCYRHRIFCRYNPKTATLENLVDFNVDLQHITVIPHLNSFVSLRSSGQKALRT